ncbi:MAG: fumarylacetoacetate hydrolase family protein [Sedimentitalea sp.]
MSPIVFDLPPSLTLPVRGETAAFPIGRIFCVGRNYAAHAAEMGFEVDREAPFYFTKSAANAVFTGATVPFALGTENYHHEMELVMAIAAPVLRATPQQARDAIYGYGCGLDMTRRDLQIASRKIQRPWDLGKDVEDSAVFAGLTRAADMGPIGAQRIHLEVNGETRQDAVLDDLIWNVEEIICDLSKFYHLRPGDLIMTGTPAGVGPVQPEDVITGGIDGLDPISLTLGGRQ